MRTIFEEIVRKGVLSVVVGMLLLGEAGAQEAGVDRVAAARALFQEGLQHLVDEQWEQAADRFQRAMALRSSPQVIFNLTTALIPLGRLVRSTELLMQLSRDPTTPAEIRRDAAARIEQLTPRLARLTVRAVGGLEGCQIFLDERPLDAVLLGVAFPIDPGIHVLIARCDGEPMASQRADLAEGESSEVLLEPTAEQADRGLRPPLPPATTAATEGPPADDQHRRPSIVRRWWFWTIIGTVVVAGAVTGGVLGARASQQEPAEVSGLNQTFFVGGDE
jgi:hypothetical protein